MFSFLHIGDIHLGYRQYKLVEREKDFFKAFLDICQKGAIEKKTDFVLITGDLFNSRSISPQTFNEAIFVLNELKKAEIPVIAIEGNHDFKESGNFNSLKGSWFEALAQNQLLYFLYASNPLELEPLVLNKKFVGGSYLDLPCGVRIIGSKWQGFNAGACLGEFAEGISKLPEPQSFKTIFMFHGGQENHLPVNRGGVSSTDFFKLEKCVDYIAMGHIHQSYILPNSAGQNFLFNAGSTEANCMSEVGIERGGLFVEYSPSTGFKANLITDFYQRKFVKLPEIKAGNFTNQTDLLSAAYNLAKESLITCNNSDQSPIVQINIGGFYNFAKSNPEIAELKQKIEDAGALYCQINWNAETSQNYQLSSQATHLTKNELERSILEQLVFNDDSLQSKDEFIETMIRLKHLTLQNQIEAGEILAEIKI